MPVGVGVFCGAGVGNVSLMGAKALDAWLELRNGRGQVSRSTVGYYARHRAYKVYWCQLPWLPLQAHWSPTIQFKLHSSSPGI